MEKESNSIYLIGMLINIFVYTCNLFENIDIFTLICYNSNSKSKWTSKLSIDCFI